MSKNEARQSGRREIPVREVKKFTVSDDLLRQRIAEKAYELYECGGCCHGHDVEDWLEAERSVLAEFELRPENKATEVGKAKA
jgi:hypothetical protein